MLVLNECSGPGYLLGEPIEVGAAMVDDQALIVHLIMEYAGACQRFMDALEAAIRKGNDVVGARRMAAEPNQHPASRQVFADMAERSEAEFRPLYDAFDRARTAARQAGNALIAACRDSDPDTELRSHLARVDPALLDRVAAAAIFLRAPFQPGPARPFMAALEEANAAVQSEPYYGQPGFKGFIYSDTSSQPAVGATWSRVRSVLAAMGAVAVSDDLLRVEITVDEGRSQKVMVSFDSLGSSDPSLAPYGIVGIYSAFSSVLRSDAMAAMLPFSVTAESDLAPLVQKEGQALLSGLGYLADGDNLGHMCLHNVLPLNLLDLGDGGRALVFYLNLVARFADQLEQKYAKQYGKTDAQDQF